MKTPKVTVIFKNTSSVLKQKKNSLHTTFREKKETFKTKTMSAFRLIPAVICKPSVVWRWLFTSRWLYISVVITLVVMKTTVPTAVDTTLSIIYPQVESKKFFGLIVKKNNDPRIERQRKIISNFLWAGAWGLNACILLLCLPGIVNKTTLRAREKEAEADAMVTVKPSESIIVYNKALKLAVDQELESSLKSKIDYLDNVIKTGNITMPPTSPSMNPDSVETGTGTIALQGQDVACPARPGSVIGPDGRYRIERELGQGAMGIVFLARDQLLFRDVALKKLTSGLNQSLDFVNRFQQEARALAQLSHSHILQIYDLVQEENQYWIAMEYVESKDLGSLIDENGKYTIEESLRLCILMAEAMEYAHNRGVVHRDFKPSNVLIAHSGDPKIMDFGLAKLSQSSIATVEGSLLGSPAFMSPEQAGGETVDARTDIYAMGVTLYQLLTGKLPFEGDLKSILTQKISGNRPSLNLLESSVPEELVAIIKNMLSTDPDDRPQTMKAVYQEMESLVRKRV